MMVSSHADSLAHGLLALFCQSIFGGDTPLLPQAVVIESSPEADAGWGLPHQEQNRSFSEIVRPQ
jgi:hypothetical protein